jgi:TetR/AcrR family transcriptional regulator, transcriptional repressor for nem operon
VVEKAAELAPSAVQETGAAEALTDLKRPVMLISMGRGTASKETALRAGVELVHRAGFSATGVAEVAAAAGMPKGSFFNHFRSKQSFASEVIARYGSEAIENIRQSLSEPDIFALDGLRSYFSFLRDLNAAEGFQSGCLIGNFAGEAAAIDDVARETLARQFDAWSAEIATFLDRWIDHDKSANIAAALLDAWQGAVLRAKAERSLTALDRFISLVLPALLQPVSQR